MKNLQLTTLIFVFTIFNSLAQVGIGTTSPDSSAELDIVSTTKGVLISRMTEAQRIAISSPAIGLMVYQNNNTTGFYYHNGTGWTHLSDASSTVQKIDDLSDAKSDSDGTNDGSSIFLGLNAGANDDSSNNYNVSIGYSSMFSNSTGEHNVAQGEQTMVLNSTGNDNTAIGAQALYSNKGKSGSVAIGLRAMFKANDDVTSGYTGNTAIGVYSLHGGAIASNNTGTANTSVGTYSLRFNTSGGANSGYGYEVSNDNTSGNNNSAFGYRALYTNKGNHYSIAIGSGAMRYADDRTTGRDTNNTAMGVDALHGSYTASNNTGRWNTSVGSSTLYSNTSGDNNVAFGVDALYSNETGNYNTSLGTNSGFSNQSGNANVFIGYKSGYNETGNNTLYIENTDANAVNALIYGEFGADNTTASNILRTNSEFQIGNPSGTGYKFPTARGAVNQILQTDGSGVLSWVNTSSFSSQKINDLSDAKSDSDGSEDGSSLFLGIDAGLNDDSSDNQNVGVGFEVLKANTSGNNNSAFGYRTLSTNIANFGSVAYGYGAMQYADDRTTGRDTYNTAIGYEALRGSTTSANNFGQYNTCLGYQSLYSITSGNGNTANGHQSLNDNSNGSDNTASGYLALENNSSGNNNVAFGSNSLKINTTGSQNIAIGQNAYYSVNNLDNTTCIGYNSGNVSNVSNRIEIGNTSVGWIGGQVLWDTYSDKRIKKDIQENVPGIDFIKRLRPVTYHLDIHKQNNLIKRGEKGKTEADWNTKYDIEQQQMTGFIAQEVEQAAQESGYDFSGVHKAKDDLGMYSISYASFVMPLVKAVQELGNQNQKSKDKSEDINKRIIQLETENKALKRRLEKIEKTLIERQ